MFAPKYETSSDIVTYKNSIKPKKEGVPINTIFYILFNILHFLKYDLQARIQAPRPLLSREREREKEREREREKEIKKEKE